MSADARAARGGKCSCGQIAQSLTFAFSSESSSVFLPCSNTRMKHKLETIAAIMGSVRNRMRGHEPGKFF